MERHIDARERNSRDATFQGVTATLRSLSLLRSLEAVVDDILEHILNLLDAKGFQGLLWTAHQCVRYDVRNSLPYLLEFLLQVVENIHDSLKCQ